MKKHAVLCDFDNTITTTNVLDSLYEKFAGPSHRIHMERWRRGEISTAEELESIFATVTASQQEMEAFLSTVSLDPGFNYLHHTCLKRDIPMAVVSDGLRWYIDYVLNFHGIGGIDVYAAEIYFDENGYRFEYPHFNQAYPLRSTAKPVIIHQYQAMGYKVIFIGDGLSDVEALFAADVVYAKDVLLTIAQEKGVQVKEFWDLRDVSRDLASITDGLNGI